MSFNNIIGNKEIKELLENIIKTNKVSHSYMFVGKSGIGKYLFAKEFANMILCIEEDKPCYNCKACIKFESENHPDFYEINTEEKTIKIEQIRFLQSKLLEKPIVSNKKVYIINDADKMTKEAQNCLLKTLEEPPEYVCIILIVSNENIMLNTIKSRCSKVIFRGISDNELKEFLSKKTEIGNITDAYIKNCDGSIEKALKIAEDQELYQEIDKIFYNLHKVSLLDVLGKFEPLYQNKDKIFDILEYINTILFQKAKQDIKYIDKIKVVEETKSKLKANANYDMSIDYLLFEILKP